MGLRQLKLLLVAFAVKPQKLEEQVEDGLAPATVVARYCAQLKLESQVEALIDLRQLKLLLVAFAVKHQKL